MAHSKEPSNTGIISAEMTVTMYSPQRLYGFCGDDGGRKVFFHMETFHPGTAPEGESAPPPIVGERVQVEYDPTMGSEDRAPRAFKVERLDAPEHFSGIVETFNADRGWGFCRGANGVSYHLHRSEVLDGRLPAAGRRVEFYGGFRKGRPRACYVRVLDD